MGDPYVTHRTISDYAEEKVNLRREDAKEYREQVNRLREKIEKFTGEHPEHGFRKMLLSGSLAKGTALRTLNDIDVALYVDADGPPDNEATFLSWLRDRLKEAYPNTPITVQQHSVCISYSGTGLDVDVVPIFYTGLSDDRGYLIDKDGGHSLLTSIPLHLKFIRKRKSAQERHFAQVVRLLKWWAKQRKDEDSNFRCKSFMLELVCAHLSDAGQDMSNYPIALADVFTYIVKTGLKERIAFTDYYSSSELPSGNVGVIEVFDPVNPENNVVDGYLESERACLVEAAEDANDAIAYAEFATTKDEAYKSWRRVLGPSFRS